MMLKGPKIRIHGLMIKKIKEKMSRKSKEKRKVRRPRERWIRSKRKMKKLRRRERMKGREVGLRPRESFQVTRN